MKCIQIFRDGKMDELTISNKNYISKLSKLSKSRGINELVKIYSWKFEGCDICCYGWYDGDKFFENLHDLPQGGMSDFIEEDSSEKILYGDIFILKYHGPILSDITISDYSVFYSDHFDNFSNYSSDNDDNIDNIENIENIECDDIVSTNNIIEEGDVIFDIENNKDDLECDDYEY
tara:strand:+ start:631 stop:1158 length:528 start_codon:yes stop_codon:yes gene_type:complete